MKKAPQRKKKSNNRHVFELLAILAFVMMLAAFSVANISIPPIYGALGACAYFIINLIYTAQRTKLDAEHIAQFGSLAALGVLLVVLI